MPLIKTKDDYYKYLDNILAGTTQIQTQPIPAETTFGGIDTTSSTTLSTDTTTLSPSAIGMARNAPYNKDTYLKSLESALSPQPEKVGAIGQAWNWANKPIGTQNIETNPNLPIPFEQFKQQYFQSNNAPAILMANRATLKPSEEIEIKRIEGNWLEQAKLAYDATYGQGSANQAILRQVPKRAGELSTFGMGAGNIISKLLEPSQGAGAITPTDIGFGALDVAAGVGSLVKPVAKGIQVAKPFAKELATSQVGSAFGDISKGVNKEPWQMTRDEYIKNGAPSIPEPNRTDYELRLLRDTKINPNNYLFHATPSLKNAKGIQERGLTAGGLSGKPESGYAESSSGYILVFKRSDIPKGMDTGDVSLVKDYKPIKPIGVFKQSEYGGNIEYNARMQELGDNPEPPGNIHYEEVKQALSEGKPVPPEVLKDYPDLAKGAKEVPIKGTEIPKGIKKINLTPQQEVVTTHSILKQKLINNGVNPDIIDGVLDVYGIKSNIDEIGAILTRKNLYGKLTDQILNEDTIRKASREILGKKLGVPSNEVDVVLAGGSRTNPKLDVQEAITESKKIDDLIKQNLPSRNDIISRFNQSTISSPEIKPPNIASSGKIPKVEPKPSVEPPVKSQAISSEVPPVKPPKMPTTETSPVPKVPPSGIDDALKQADAIVKNDRPGLITNLIDRIPGLKQLQRGIHPAVGMKESILKGWIGLGHTRATISNTLHADLLPTVSKLDDSFGKGSSAGNKVNIKFIGTPEQQVPFTGTLYDIMQRPQLYELTDLQKTLLTNIQANKLTNLQKYKGLYNLEIGEFPTSPGAVHLANVDKSKTGILMAGSENATLARGRAKTRFYETGADRYQHDIELYKQGKIKKEDVFDPNLDVGRLLNADHETLSAMAGQNVFKTALGGKTKLEVMQEVNPELAKKMEALRKRVQKLQGYKNVLKEEQSQAIDNFLNSNMESDDLLYLRDSLELKPGRYVAKVEAGKTLPDIQKEIDGVRLQIKALQPAWKTANPRGYVSVNEGGLYQYFKAEDAKAIRKLLKTSDNPVLRYIDELRSTAFGGDLSPGSIQGVNAWLADPIGVSKAIAKEIKNNKSNLFASFSEIDLAKDVKANPESWNRFTQATGLNPLGKFQREEFGTGFIARIPKIGGKWAEANDALYRGLVRISKDSFDSIYEQGIKQGLSAEKAAAIAADDVTKLIPSYSYRRLGLSQKQSAIYRAALTSVSFLKQPVNLMSDAVKGLVKLGTFRKVSPAEAYAMKRTLTLASMVSTIAVTSNVIYAKNHGKDPAKAALASVTPGDPYFWSLVLPNGDRIGLGGPFRSLIKAVAPGKLGNIPFPVPFAGVGKFAMGKMNPGVKIAYDEIRNKDYYGKQIRTGEFPVNILQGLEYAFEGAAPLTVGSALEDIRRGEPEKIPTDVASQFAGVNLTKLDKVWDLTREWTANKDFEPYTSITADDPEAQSKRSEWRKNNPQGDAKLFISGEVDSIETISGAANAIKLIKDNGIDPKQIDSLNKYYTDHPDYAKLGYSDIDPIDILAYKLSGKPYTQDYVNKLNYLSLKDRYKEVQKQYDAIQYGDTYEDNKKETEDRQALLNNNTEWRDGLRRHEVLSKDPTASISIQEDYIKYFQITGDKEDSRREDFRRSNPEFSLWYETNFGRKPLETKKATTSKTGSTPFR